jgi:hypothetical protein
MNRTRASLSFSLEVKGHNGFLVSMRDSVQLQQRESRECESFLEERMSSHDDAQFRSFYLRCPIEEPYGFLILQGESREVALGIG